MLGDATVEIGPLRLEVEHRNPVASGGPTLRGELAERLAQAGHQEPLPQEGLAEAIDRVEVALRNPPARLDELREPVLRERSGEKWRLYPDDVLALWVADMDFPAADPIRRRLRRAIQVSDLGYPTHPAPTPLPELFAERARERFGWQVEPALVELVTEVVQGIHVCIQQFSEPGDGVIVQTPIYPPFLGAVRDMGRTLRENPLVEGEGGLVLDVAGLREQAAAGARLLLLCSPHNPSGRVFRREELTAIAEVAEEHDLLVVSDEIHAELVYPGFEHIPFAAISPEAAARTITLTSASKPFNIAGLRCAVAVFGSTELRRRFMEFPRHLRGGLGSLGILATEAAWRYGDPWLAEVQAYLEGNRRFLADFVARELPGVRHRPPEATYLAWLDCRALDLQPSPYRYFLERGKVALSDGANFGAPGRGFARVNFATSRAILEAGLERLAKALR
jgi:cystathionine beta-lyase